MRIIGKMLSAALLAGVAVPALAQTPFSSFFAPSPKLITKINHAYSTSFAVPASAHHKVNLAFNKTARQSATR